MTVAMGKTRINYRSDFDFILRLVDCEGREVGFPPYDWTARVYTGIKANAFVASCIGGVCTGCYNDNGRIHVVCDGHRLTPGRLNVEFVAELPEGIYPDGGRRHVTPVPLDIELVTGAGCCPSDIEVEAVIPYATIDAYDMARAAAGWSAATVALAETVKARLTDEEIAAITAKGYTIA